MLRHLIRRRPPRFLVVRQPDKNGPHPYDVILDWLAEHYPEYAPLFQVEALPYRMPILTNYVLHIPWLQDPVQKWSPEIYQQAKSLGERCDRREIPIINRVDRLTNAGKAKGAGLMAATGLRTPQMALIRNQKKFRETLLGIPLPLFVREDWGHGSRMLRADTHEEARRIPLKRFKRPVAVELIDIPSRSDGLYRKYRYVAAGDIGVSHHVQVSDTWITRGEHRVRTAITREEELAYIAHPDPNCAALQEARQALGLDFVAFDYSYDHDGRMVVWEANPYPMFKFSTKDLVYRNGAIHRTIAAALMMYLRYAGLPVPEKLEAEVAYLT